MAKLIYLVRHGITEANVRNIVQGAEDPLIPEGRAQAKRLAERAQHLTFDTIVSSDYQRAVDTASIVAEATGHSHEQSPLLREMMYPTSLVNLPKEVPEVQRYFKERAQHAHDSSWRFDDEENFQEILVRGQKALTFLRDHPAEKLFVVTHGNFKRILLGVILFAGGFDFATWQNIYDSFKTTNTGITLLKYKNDRWEIRTWNDHAHLAD